MKITYGNEKMGDGVRDVPSDFVTFRTDTGEKLFDVCGSLDLEYIRIRGCPFEDRTGAIEILPFASNEIIIRHRKY